MLQWETRRRELDALETEIAAAVLELGKTQTVGNVRASYSAGRKAYDYEGAFYDQLECAEFGQQHHLELIKNKHRKEVFDYRAICSDAEITEIPFTQGNPSVSVKLID